MNKPFCLLILPASVALAGCTTVLEYLPVYKIDIQQGNIVDQTMVDQLKPNMTKRQVLYVLGSPMLDDAFRQNRWDYLYSEQRSGEDREQKRLSIFFNEEDLVSGLQGDFKPGVAPMFKTNQQQTIDVPKRDIEKTLWEKIAGLFGYEGVEDSPSPLHKEERRTTENNLPL